MLEGQSGAKGANYRLLSLHRCVHIRLVLDVANHRMQLGIAHLQFRRITDKRCDFVTERESCLTSSWPVRPVAPMISNFIVRLFYKMDLWAYLGRTRATD